MLVLGLNLICLTATLACQETLDPRLAAAGGSPARVVTVTDTVLPSRDTYISKTLPNQNFGSSDTLRTGGPNRNRALLAFDSAAIAQVVGTGQLDSAWLELTIVLTDGLGASGRTFDLHRLGSNWTELGATWNCPVDANTANDSPNCTGTSWDMTNGNAYASSYTARVTVVDQQTGVLRLNVTSDVAAFLGGTTNNYGWIFRKTNESLSGGTVTFSRNNPATGPRLVLSITRVTVPATPPDSVPTAVLNEIGNLMTIVRDSQGTYPPNFVQVLFQRSAAQADRQQAVDLIRGEVVGGVPLTEGGIYVVRLAPGATLDSLRAVISTLKALPQVVVAMPVYLGELDLPFVRPADGTGWTRTDWNLLANQAAGDNWALERINAPLAWGCQTGDTLVQIAVVDRGFRDVSQVRQDLWPNVAPSDQALFSATDTMNHGSRIASVLAAVGNNGKGMTGVLWQTRLRVFERNRFGTPGGPLIAAAFYALESAVQSGIPIVSMSMAYPWRNPDGTLRRANPSSPQDVQLIEDQFSVIKQAAQKWDDTGHKPLLVLAAGNDGIDARWALFPRLAEVLPSRVLVVGAANRSQTGDTLWRTPQDESNTGLLVSVVAPGEEVAGFDKDGNISLASGTSVATPMVAGIAGLLLSADPTLSADSLRSLILAGANRSGRTAAGIPLVNAYESLRAASEASGTPLCGNEVWVANGVLKARRGSTTETLATLNDTTGLVNVRHGGRRLDVYTNGIGLRVFQYDAGTRSWNEASNPYSLPDPLPGGTYLSSLFASHDGDSSVSVLQSVLGNQAKVTVRVTSGGQTQPIDSFTVTVTPYSQASCRKELLQSDSVTYSCVDSTAVGTTTSIFSRPAFSPLGDRILVAVNRKQETITLDAQFSPCPGTAFIGSNPQSRCKGYSYSGTSLGHDLWQVALPSRTHSLLQSFSGPNVWWLGLSEDGARLVAGTGTQQTSYRIEPSLTGGWQQTGVGETWPDCAVSFRQAGTWAFLNAEPSPEACTFLESAGTIAPIRAAVRGR